MAEAGGARDVDARALERHVLASVNRQRPARREGPAGAEGERVGRDVARHRQRVARQVERGEAPSPRERGVAHQGHVEREAVGRLGDEGVLDGQPAEGPLGAVPSPGPEVDRLRAAAREGDHGGAPGRQDVRVAAYDHVAQALHAPGGDAVDLVVPAGGRERAADPHQVRGVAHGQAAEGEPAAHEQRRAAGEANGHRSRRISRNIDRRTQQLHGLVRRAATAYRKGSVYQ